MVDRRELWMPRTVVAAALALLGLSSWWWWWSTNGRPASPPQRAVPDDPIGAPLLRTDGAIGSRTESPAPAASVALEEVATTGSQVPPKAVHQEAPPTRPDTFLLTLPGWPEGVSSLLGAYFVDPESGELVSSTFEGLPDAGTVPAGPQVFTLVPDADEGSIGKAEEPPYHARSGVPRRAPEAILLACCPTEDRLNAYQMESFVPYSLDPVTGYREEQRKTVRFSSRKDEVIFWFEWRGIRACGSWGTTFSLPAEVNTIHWAPRYGDPWRTADVTADGAVVVVD